MHPPRPQPDPADGRSWCALGLASLRAREPAQARIHFARAAALLPGRIGHWHGLAWSCLLLEDLHAALAAFRQALALDDQCAESHGGVALVLWLAGRHEEAGPHLARSHALDPHSVTGRQARALQAGQLRDPATPYRLAARLLDHPVLFPDTCGNSGIP